MLRCLVLLAVAPLLAAPAEPGLLAWWPCDEGQGTTLHDASGHGCDGQLSQVEWVKFGDGWCLRLNGRDSVAQFGALPQLQPTQAVTLEAWVLPEQAAQGEPGIVGRDYSSYILTFYTDGNCYWYLGGGPIHVGAPLTGGRWHHVVGTFDGRRLRLYLDGQLAAEKELPPTKVPAGKPFYFGASDGEPQYTKHAHFGGLLDEVRVYDHALTAAEIQHRYQTSHLSHEIGVTVQLAPFAGELTALLDLRGLGDLTGRQAVVHGLLTQPGSPKPALAAFTQPVTGSDAVWTARPTLIRPGKAELRAWIGADGAVVGRPATVEFDWPALPAAAGARRLNNLVTQLLDLPQPAPGTWTITAPRAGWLWLTGGTTATIKLDGQVVTRGGEAMRKVAAGPHQVALEGASERLRVHAIPELIFAQYGANPHVTPFGKYEEDFCRRFIFPHCNVMISHPGAAPDALVAAWRAEGKQWFGSCAVPGTQEPITAAQAAAYWRAQPGFADPRFDGTLVDEFNGYSAEKYDAWCAALHTLHQDPATRGRLFYPYGHLMAATPAGRRFCEEVIAGGGKFAMERYLPEQDDPSNALRFIDQFLLGAVRAWRSTLPGSVEHLIVVVGTFSQPPESLDVNPAMNHHAYLDEQFYRLANDPAALGLAGLETYLSSYTDEETVRYCAQLFRHYGIEGRATHYRPDPLILDLLTNPDFAHGADGWTIQAAAPGSVAPLKVPGLGWLEGRYPQSSRGDLTLALTRSAQAANLVSQPLSHLEPGRWYSLRLFSVAPQQMGTKATLGLTVQLDGGTIDAAHSFQHVFPSCYDHRFGPYNSKTPAWMNFHWIVFQATAATGRVTLSDWRDGQPAGPAGQTIAVNFIQVQPYEPAGP